MFIDIQLTQNLKIWIDFFYMYEDSLSEMG